MNPGLPERLAKAASGSTASAPSSPPGGLAAHSIGYVYLPAALGVAAASVLAAPYGTRLAHRISGPQLKRVFALFLVAVAVSLLLEG